jgi:hypothetical protein
MPFPGISRLAGGGRFLGPGAESARIALDRREFPRYLTAPSREHLVDLVTKLVMTVSPMVPQATLHGD